MHKFRCIIPRIDAQPVVKSLKGILTLIHHVVNCKDRPGTPDLPMAILSLQEKRDQPGLPVIAVKHIRKESDSSGSFDYSTAEICVLLSFCVPAPVNRIAEVLFIVNKVIRDIVEK